MTESVQLFSVVVPVKNAAQTITRMLNALREQTHPNVETIVVDGGSTDGTLELIRESGLPRLRILNDPHGGITSAVNMGIRSSAGSLVLPWMCADDYLAPDFLGLMANTLSTPGVDFAYGNWHAVDRGMVTKSCKPVKRWEDRIKYRMPVVLPNAFAFRRSVFDRVGLLDESLKYANDYDLLRKISIARLAGAYCPDAWYYYQLGGLSERRYLQCALEVARSAIGHGSSIPLVYAFLLRQYAATKISFLLNRVRRRLRAR